MYVCMCVCMHVCMCVCMYIYINSINIYIITYMYVNVTHALTSTLMSHTYIFISLYMQTVLR